MNETIQIGIMDLWSGNYSARFDLFLLLFLGIISIMVLFVIIFKLTLDSYIEDKIWEHKRECKKTK